MVGKGVMKGPHIYVCVVKLLVFITTKQQLANDGLWARSGSYLVSPELRMVFTFLNGWQ